MAAVTYFIAGKSNCPFFAKAQRIGEIITRNLPSVAVRINTQHPQEWPAYLDSLCTRLHFAHKTSPIVYTQLGTLIGGSDAFYALVNKMYGNIVEFPASILNDIAKENHEQAMKEMQIKETIAHNKAHEEQWDMRNERLSIIKEQVVVNLNSQMETISKLSQSCQNVKATLTVAPEKNSMEGEPIMLQKHLATLSTLLPKVDLFTLQNSSLTSLAESLSNIPSAHANSTDRFTRVPDTLWKLMFLDHQKVMSEFVTTLNRMHEANQIVQEEANKLAQAAPPPVRPTAQPPTALSSSNSSPFSIPVDKLPKSVSYAGVDTQYSPKEPSHYYSLPSTPKKNDPSGDIKENAPVIPKIDVAPMENAIKAMRAVVDEGLSLLKNAKKQLRIDIANANKQVTSLQTVLDHDEFRHFKLRERKEIGKNVHLFRFELPSPNDVLGCPLGKHIKLRIGDTERAYSPITTDHDKGHFDLAVKVTRDTPIMDLFANLTPGDWIQVRGPTGTSVFKETEKVSGISMFAHGVGLTPMLQVIRHHLLQDEATPLWLLYFNADEKMLMRDELERLSAAHTRFNFRCQTTKPGNHWEHLQEKDLVASLPFRPAGFDHTSDSNPLKILICGTKHFSQKTKSILEDMGYRAETIHTFE
eukprot:Phypoly_transcript_05048.p1 GENE.Phypoly_transcript_05048~~Phypoly_transcript_05048.p1  ORF type:complete len:660 (+),score=108.38 Phypoly_transcript_05048:58-1980(+)